VNVSSTLTNTTIWFLAALSLTVNVRTDVWTFLPGLLGHLSGDDLINVQNDIPLHRQKPRDIISIHQSPHQQQSDYSQMLIQLFMPSVL